MENVLVAKKNDTVKKNADKNKYLFEKCDGTDYAIAVTAGVIAGFVDVVFVGKPGESILGNQMDKAADKLVVRMAKMTGWKDESGNNSITAAISHLEDYTINYDLSTTKETGDLVDNLSLKNHHYKSLGHSPSLVGLFFAILDQFSNTATFVSNGRLITVDTSGSDFRLQGDNLPAKLFCGICNWFFHLMSDIAGSSSTRRRGLDRRGAGLTIPGMEFFNLCNFGSFKNGDETNTLAQSMVKVFESGYDLRFGAAMAIPVLLQDLIIRVLWVIRARYDKGREWKDCIPNSSHGDLRIMLIAGDATLCIIDGLDAVIRSGGDFVQFVLRLNYVAWFKLVKMVIKEVVIRCEFSLEYLELELTIIDEAIQEYIRKLDNIDMEYVERELESLHEMNVMLLETKDEKELTEILYQSLEVSGIKLQFHSHNDFLKFMETDEPLLL